MSDPLGTRPDDVLTPYRDSTIRGEREAAYGYLSSEDRAVPTLVESYKSQAVYFEAPDGSIIAEEDYHPVLVTQFSLGDNKPLELNYIWRMKRYTFYKTDSVPSEWKEGAASAEVTDIEFASE